MLNLVCCHSCEIIVIITHFLQNVVVPVKKFYMSQICLKLYMNSESMSAACRPFAKTTTTTKNKLVLFHHCVILQGIANEGDILKDTHKSSDISMLDFLKSKYTAPDHDRFC